MKEKRLDRAKTTLRDNMVRDQQLLDDIVTPYAFKGIEEEADKEYADYI